METTEIKRYDLCYDQMTQEPQGEWVRWEDMEKLLRGRDNLWKMVKELIANDPHVRDYSEKEPERDD